MPCTLCPECGIPIGTPAPSVRPLSILALLPFFCAFAALVICIWAPLHSMRPTRQGMWSNTISQFSGPDFTVGYLRRVADGSVQSNHSLTSLLLDEGLSGLTVPSAPFDAQLSIGVGPCSGVRREIVGFGWPALWGHRCVQTPFDDMIAQTGTHPAVQPEQGRVFFSGLALVMSPPTDVATGRWTDWVIDGSGIAISASIVLLCWHSLCAIRWCIHRWTRTRIPWVAHLPTRATAVCALLIALVGFLPLRPNIRLNADKQKQVFYETHVTRADLKDTATNSDQSVARRLLAALPPDSAAENLIAFNFQMHPGMDFTANVTLLGLPPWIVVFSQTRVDPFGGPATPFPPSPPRFEFIGWDRFILFASVPPGFTSRSFLQFEPGIVVQQLFLTYLAWVIPAYTIRQIRDVITRRRTRNNACTACGYTLK